MASKSEQRTFIYYVIAISVSIIVLSYGISWGVAYWKTKKELTEETEALLAQHKELHEQYEARNGRKRSASEAFHETTPERRTRSAGDAAVNLESEQPIRAARSALQLDPSSVPMRKELGSALIAAGRTEEAIQVLREGVQFSPYVPELRELLGRALEKNGQKQAALEEYQALAMMDPKNAEHLVSVGRVLESLGRTNEALKRYQQAASENKVYEGHYQAALSRLSNN